MQSPSFYLKISAVAETPKFHCRPGVMRKLLLFSLSTSELPASSMSHLYQGLSSAATGNLTPQLPPCWQRHSVFFFFFNFALIHITVLPNAALWRNLGHESMSDRQGRLGIWVLPLGNFSKYRKICWKRWPAMTMPDTHFTGPSYGAICSYCPWARGREMPFSKMTVLEFLAFCYFPLPSCDCPLSLSSLQSAYAQIFNI